MTIVNDKIKCEIDCDKILLNIGSAYDLVYVCIYREGGTLVTYGGMSKKPIKLATGPLIFKVYFYLIFIFFKTQLIILFYFSSHLHITVFVHIAESEDGFVTRQRDICQYRQINNIIIISERWSLFFSI